MIDPIEAQPPTGEPDAGDPQVRFGGRGSPQALPTPILFRSIIRQAPEGSNTVARRSKTPGRRSPQTRPPGGVPQSELPPPAEPSRPIPGDPPSSRRFR